MREIKFRGKSLDNGKWVVGYLVYVTGKPHVIPNPVLGGWHKYCVDPETVGQYTGLKDCKGREIYEGDIILEDKDPTILEIVFRDGIFFASIGKSRGENPYMNCALRVILDRRKTHVIGNIHDNPELLKGGEE